MMSISVGIITISDKAAHGQREDLSGPMLKELVTRQGWVVKVTMVIPDIKDLIQKAISKLTDFEHCDLVLTTGGTGFSPSDVTPEATRAILEKEAPGLAEHIRRENSLRTPNAILSRGVCGIRRHSLIVNLPGSPEGAKECLECILPVIPHGIAKILGDTTECAKPPNP
jgi:molybdopterin adenylyltransferase